MKSNISVIIIFAVIIGLAILFTVNPSLRPKPFQNKPVSQVAASVDQAPYSEQPSAQGEKQTGEENSSEIPVENADEEYDSEEFDTEDAVENTPSPFLTIPPKNSEEESSPGPDFKADRTFTLEGDRRLQKMQAAADRLYEEKRYDEAIQAYDDIIKIDDRWAGAYFGKSRVLLDQGRGEEALGILNKQVNTVPVLPEALVNRAQANYILKRYPEALDDLKRAIRKNPNDFRAYFIAGLSLSRLKNYDEAIKMYSKALELKHDGDNGQAIYMARADAWSSKRKFKNAENDIKSALKAGAFSSHILIRLAELYEVTGRDEKAIKVIEDLLQRDPELKSDPYLQDPAHLAGAFSEVGNNFLHMGEYPPAIQFFSKALKIDPSNELNVYTRGITYFRSGDIENSKKDMAEWLKMNPPSERAEEIERLAYAHAILGHKEKALKYIKTIVEKNPNQEGRQFALGEIYYINGEREKGKAIIRKIGVFDNKKARLKLRLEPHLLEYSERYR